MTKEELSKLKVGDVIKMEAFLKEMEKQVAIEEKAHTDAILGGNYKRSPLDSIRKKGVFNAADLVCFFECILNKSLIGFSSMERQYIYALGMTCFTRLMIAFQKEAEPEEKNAE